MSEKTSLSKVFTARPLMSRFLMSCRLMPVLLLLGAAGLLPGCSREPAGGWPTLQADRTWDDIAAERDKPLTPDSPPLSSDPLPGPAAGEAGRMSATGWMSATDRAALEDAAGTLEALAADLEIFRRDLARALDRHEASDEAGWRGAQLILSRLVDRHNRLAAVMFGLEELRQRWRNSALETAPEAALRRLEDLLAGARLQQQATGAAIRRAQRQLDRAS